jgi:hypothetical protein
MKNPSKYFNTVFSASEKYHNIQTNGGSIKELDIDFEQ